MSRVVLHIQVNNIKGILMPFIRNQNRKKFKEQQDLALLCTELRISGKAYVALSDYYFGELDECEAAKKEVWESDKDKFKQLQDFFHKAGKSL